MFFNACFFEKIKAKQGNKRSPANCYLTTYQRSERQKAKQRTREATSDKANGQKGVFVIL